MARQHIVYSAFDMPDVEVLVDGHWCRGELRMQIQDDDGSWRFNVQYRRLGNTPSHVDTFAEGQVRRDYGAAFLSDL